MTDLRRHVYSALKTEAVVFFETLVPIYHTYLITDSLTPWSRAPLEQLTGLQLVKKFPAFHGTRRFITALTSAFCLNIS